jgi:hypothetical protein
LVTSVVEFWFPFMKLAISLSRDIKKWFLYLSEEESHPFRIIISHNDLPKVMSEELYSHLMKNDKDLLIPSLTKNQQIVLLYFFHIPYTPSFLIMNQWFTDINCDFALSQYLSNLVYKSRNDGKHDADILFEVFSDTLLTENIFSFSNYNLNNKTVWNFNLVSELKEDESDIANLVAIRESYFLIEDHACLITGFSVSYTSFLELISGYQSDILHPLCKLVPLQYRDIKTIGQIFIEYHEIFTILTKTFSKGFEFYGINHSGKLINYTSLFNTKGEVNFRDWIFNMSRDVSIIPLFIKFDK